MFGCIIDRVSRTLKVYSLKIQEVKNVLQLLHLRKVNHIVSQSFKTIKVQYNQLSFPNSSTHNETIANASFFSIAQEDEDLSRRLRGSVSGGGGTSRGFFLGMGSHQCQGSCIGKPGITRFQTSSQQGQGGRKYQRTTFDAFDDFFTAATILPVDFSKKATSSKTTLEEAWEWGALNLKATVV